MKTICMMLLCLHNVQAAPQLASRKPSISIDSLRPYVDMVFDHLGNRQPLQGEEVRTGVWLRLRNNCILPIRIRVRREQQRGDRLILAHDIIEHPSSIPKIPDSRQKRSKPEGYSSIDVIQWEIIQPGSALLFSLPLSHISRDWSPRFEIELMFPEQARGIQPTTFVYIHWINLPSIAQLAADSDATATTTSEK